MSADADLALCAVPTCEEPVKSGSLMCEPHWDMVSKPKQRSLIRHYTAGQFGGNAKPSQAWRDAARRAIAHVLKAEKEAS